jgi:ATP-dependent phosphofructokinase / diphosphate-dependent phosphofructokinase
LKIGILNGGGDCAGLNAVTRAVVMRAEAYGWEVIGIRYGWDGFLRSDIMQLSFPKVEGLIAAGGTILKSSRTNPAKHANGFQIILENATKLGLDAIICVGGDDTLGVAFQLFKKGLKVVGVPKTMDNDLSGTDYTFGFDSAVNEATHAIDNLRTTAESHDRIFVVEIMGREAGWVAAYAGIASGANLVIVPEEPFDLQELISFVKKRHERGDRATVIVVSEGATLKKSSAKTAEESVDEFGHVRLGGIGQFIGEQIEKATKFDTRVSVLGHMIRGGSPTAFDRVLSTQFGLAAVDLIKEEKFGMMTSLRGTKITSVTLEESVSKQRLLDPEILDTLRMVSH